MQNIMAQISQANFVGAQISAYIEELAQGQQSAAQELYALFFRPNGTPKYSLLIHFDTVLADPRRIFKALDGLPDQSDQESLVDVIEISIKYARDTIASQAVFELFEAISVNSAAAYKFGAHLFAAYLNATLKLDRCPVSHLAFHDDHNWRVRAVVLLGILKADASFLMRWQDRLNPIFQARFDNEPENANVRVAAAGGLFIGSARSGSPEQSSFAKIVFNAARQNEDAALAAVAWRVIDAVLLQVNPEQMAAFDMVSA